MRLRQISIWDELERELPPGLAQVRELLELWDTEDLVRDLEKDRGNGRDDYQVRPMLHLILIQPYLRHGRFSQLLGDLRRNGDLARLLGFKEVGPNRYLTPTASALSRFHSKLKQPRFQRGFELLHRETVRLLKVEHPELGNDTALDTSDVRTHGTGAWKGKDGQERPSTDPEASWSVKTKRWEDGQGRTREETKSSFGYKAAFLVDVQVPAVLAVTTVTGKSPDQALALPLLDAGAVVIGKGQIRTCSMDKGFDSNENVTEAFARGVAAIVPVREVPKDLDSAPAQDREVVVSGNIVRDRYSGAVACYANSKDGKQVRREMTYAGFERDRETHKFRCPLGASAASSCQAYSTCSAGSCGKQGRQVRIPMKEDPRRFAPVYPRSLRWGRIYKGRTAVERINSYVKEVLRLEDHCLRGRAAISLRVLLAAITLNSRTLLSLRELRRRKAGGQAPAA